MVTIRLSEAQAVALCNMLNELDYDPDAEERATESLIEQVQAQANFAHDGGE